MTKYISFPVLVLSTFLLIACSRNNSGSETEKKDPHSFANPAQVRVSHLDLDLKIDFINQSIDGKAEWAIENIAKTDTVIFDTKEIKIEKVTLGDDHRETSYSLGEKDKYLGQALKIKISPSTSKVTIWYKTSKDAAALQWLNPEQTLGKKHPFLYTQSEAILARTWVPCQDSPGIRFTYNASVTVPQGLMALMSAENPQQRSANGRYTFRQPHPIPSYLMALAVGDLDFKAVDKRTGIYAEPAALDKAAWEFADMGKMVDAAEKLYGPYRWGRYDVLVLPPSFPFGGMENPMLTFATPTVIAGDRSLVSLVAHELAHSWSGNLVTNATWNDFWLNEGFTVYFERRIIEEVYGKQEARMQEVLGFESLKETIADMGKENKDTRLKGNFAGRDPDDGMTDIAYEKGYSFLRTIEEAAGRQAFDAFLKQYFKRHSFQSVTTEDFVNDLETGLINKNPGLRDKIEMSRWIYEPGIPANVPPVNSREFEAIDSMVSSWKNSLHIGELRKQLKTANELLYFIKALPDSISAAHLKALDKEFSFTRSGNAEIQCSWYLLAIRHHYTPAYSYIEEFLTNVGRRKFLIPLYKEMVLTKDGKAWAKEIYKKARPNYHSVSYNTIDAILK
ncbi:M1 family metallopeptidase [Pararcticibacter amylolyticus]|uniref:Aminopeptidase N n=1 Tax=Pararcticibacter amylolyticus TaxID=2173175 RepID=A0A2U2PMZ0_9SPHI|nr:M1 family metallopeptidase [Pararcticibacter amylolyticus]PWG82549.1 aminopeptidase [Pararcticibacter amylolyticus]